MKSILRIAIDDSVLVSSSVAEDDAPAYSADAVYAIGDTCIDNHQIYTSLIASNAGKSPATSTGGSTPAWSLSGYTNQRRMFDPYNNTKTISSGGSDLVCVLDVSYCDAIALFGVDGETLRVDVANSQGDVVYSKTVDLLIDDHIQNISDYFYAARYWMDTIWIDLPMMTAARITMKISGGDAPACGNCIVGESRYLGGTQYDANLPSTDYSIFSTNDFGGIYLSKGASATGAEGDVAVETSLVRAVTKARDELYGIATAFFCANDVHDDGLSDVMLVYGVLRKFEQTVKLPTVQEFSFVITGVK